MSTNYSDVVVNSAQDVYLYHVDAISYYWIMALVTAEELITNNQ